MLRRLGLSLLVAFALCAIASSSASADQPTWSDLSQDQKNVIANAALALSGREPTYADPGGQGEAFASHLLDVGKAPSDIADADALAKGELGLIKEPEVIPPLRRLVPRLLRATGVGAAFVAAIALYNRGAWIYMKFGTSDDPDATPGAWTYISMQWADKGYIVYEGATVQQDPGAYVLRGELNGSNFLPVRFFEDKCDFSEHNIPPGAHLQTGVDSGANCYFPVDHPPWQELAPVIVDYPYYNESDVHLTAPLRPWTPNDPVDSDGSKYPSTLPPDFDPFPGLGRAFDSPDARLLNAEYFWFAYDQDPMTEPVPFGTDWSLPPLTDWRRWCERSNPGAGYYENSPPNDPYEQKESFPSSLVENGDPRPVKLLWGADYSGTGDYQYINGFGFRKIALKHGWTPADAADTAEALAVGDKSERRPGSNRWVFRGPTYSPVNPLAPENALCTRTVVVDTEQRTGDPAPREIVTSYGDVINRADFGLPPSR